MGFSRSLGLTLLAAACIVQAAPAPFTFTDVAKRQTITALTTSQISSFKPFTFYASAAYCKPANTLAWDCGTNCQANSGFQPVASGGDGSLTQFWYVGFDPSLRTVIVSHQGTDTSKLLPVLTDATIAMARLNSDLFPGVSSSVLVHAGFAGSQSRSASDVLSAVQTAITKFKATHVTIVGHSLGAAIALIDSVFLPLHISGVTFKTITYGMPRVGNQAFADYVDAHVSLTHINNKKDPVPIVPGRFLGFHHPSGEVHIEEDEAWASCPGQDNTDDQCIVGAVPNLLASNEANHDGPYDGVQMQC